MNEPDVRPLTSGPAAHYPLYYFTPSMTSDGRYLIVHEQHGQDVQLCRVDIETGETQPLTDGKTDRGGWARWCDDTTTGIYNHLSALNLSTNEIWWFESPPGQPELLQLNARNLETLEERRVLTLPGRISIGQSAFSPDGKQFAFIHTDASAFWPNFDAYTKKGWGHHQEWRQQTPAVIETVDTETGSHQSAISLEFHVHHVIFADNDHILVNHVEDGNGMWVMNLQEGPSSIRTLRPADEKGRVCHQVVTERGIDYEVFSTFSGEHKNTVGRHAWPGDHWVEIPLGVKGYAHTGWDPAGQFCFYEVSSPDSHALYALLHPLDPERRELRKLKELAPYPGHGQRFHAHPFLSWDRKWMIFTEAVDGISQVYALDVKDLTSRKDIGWPSPLP